MTPETSEVAFTVMLAIPSCAEAVALRIRLPAWFSARLAGLNLAVTPEGRPTTLRFARPVKLCTPRLDRLRI